MTRHLVFSDQKKINITVGIVSYNTSVLTLRKLIESLKKSDCSLKIVLLCNSQNEIYQSELFQISKEYQINLLNNQPNRGFGAGHNTIAQEFQAEWYVCCNPDVMVRPDSISKLIQFADEKPDAVMLMPRVVSENGTVQPLARRHLTLITWIHRQLWRLMPRLFKPFEISFDYHKSQPVDFVTGCFFAIRHEKFRRLGGFDEQFFLYSEDADLSYRASKIGSNYFVATSEITHFWTTDKTRNHRIIFQELKSLIYYFGKHNLWLS
jgi:GT2 family glycosyltransferase